MNPIESMLGYCQDNPPLWLGLGLLAWLIGLPPLCNEKPKNIDKVMGFVFAVAFGPLSLFCSLFFWSFYLVMVSKLGQWLESTEFYPKKEKKEERTSAKPLEDL